MRIALLQTDPIWENPGSNITKIETFIGQLKIKSDLILFPEMFSTGFTMNNSQLAESMDGKTIGWMKSMASSLNSALSGSLIIRDKGKYYNRFVFTGANGELYSYNKRHLFRMECEENHFDPGSQRIVFSYLNWRICPQVCYDLRFPVWSRNRNDYDLLIYVSNWPSLRSDIWKTLLKARAIENLAYVIGINRTGKDGNGIEYHGNSMVVDPKGEIIAEAGNDEEILETNISLDELKTFRSKFPAWKDADDFTIDL